MNATFSDEHAKLHLREIAVVGDILHGILIFVGINDKIYQQNPGCDRRIFLNTDTRK